MYVFHHLYLQIILLSSDIELHQRKPKTSLRTEASSLDSSSFSLPNFCQSEDDLICVCVLALCSSSQRLSTLKILIFKQHVDWFLYCCSPVWK